MTAESHQSVEELLARDVLATIPSEHQPRVHDFAQAVLSYMDPQDPDYAERLVDDVQQYFRRAHRYDMACVPEAWQAPAVVQGRLVVV